jgi:acetolactate synthase I/III small subunit
MEELKEYTVSVFTENHIGLLNRISIIFTRRKINVDSLTTSSTEMDDVYRFTIVIRTTSDIIKKVVKQIEKQVEVIKAFYYEADQIIYQEIALYKMSTEAFASSQNVEKIIRDNHARILTVEPEFIVIEKTGYESETEALLNQLKPYGILSFARSGRVAIAKPMRRLASFMEDLEEKPYPYQYV